MEWEPAKEVYQSHDGKPMGAYAHWWLTKEKDLLPDDLGMKLNTKLFLGRTVPSGQGSKVSDALYASGEAVPLPAEVHNGSFDPDMPWDYKDIEALLPDTADIDPDTVITGILDTGISLSHMRTNIEPGNTRILASWQQGAAMRRKKTGESVQNWLPCGDEVYHGRINAGLRKYGDVDGVVDETEFNRALGLSVPCTFLGNRDLEMAAAHGTHTLDLAAGMDHGNTCKDDRARQRIIAVNLPAQYSHGSGGNFLAYFAVYGVERIIHIADALWHKKYPNPEEGQMRGFPIVINFSYGMVAGPKDGNHIFEAALWRIIDARAEKFDGNASPVRLLMPAGNDNLQRGAASAVLGKRGEKHSLTKYQAQESVTLPWRIKPEDSTANFCEVWSEAQPCSVFDAMRRSLKVSVSPPGHKGLLLPSLNDKQFHNLGNFARVYVRHVVIDHNSSDLGIAAMGTDLNTDSDGGTFLWSDVDPKPREAMVRLVLLICTGPTYLDAPNAPLAPAGEWTINVEFKGYPVDFTFYIQTDQSAVVTSKTGRRSYFDHPAFRTHAAEHPNHDELSEPDKTFPENGTVLDTFSYDMRKPFDDKDHEIDNDRWNEYGPVQRRGMNNALSTVDRPELISVAAYDDSNGRPASYSSSFDGNATKPSSETPRMPALKTGAKSKALPKEVAPNVYNAGRDMPTVSFPGENGPSLFGLLAAGGRDGSVVAIRGTSMATALATRRAAQAFTNVARTAWAETATDAWFRRLAEYAEPDDKHDVLGQIMPWPRPYTDPLDPDHKGGRLKMGSGRLADPRDDLRPHRLGGDA